MSYCMVNYALFFSSSPFLYMCIFEVQLEKLESKHSSVGSYFVDSKLTRKKTLIVFC